MTFTFSNIRPVLNRKKVPCLRFTLTTEASPGKLAETRNGCLAGIGKDGPWAMPPASPYKNYLWAKDLEDMVLAGLASKGLMEGLGSPFKAEPTDLIEAFTFGGPNA